MAEANVVDEEDRAADEVPYKRIILPETPAAQSVNLKFVQQPAEKKEPRQKPDAFQKASVAAVDSFLMQASSLAETVTWTLERVGPTHTDDGKRVPCGTFPDEYSGPATALVIGSIAGGGTYYVSYNDPKSGEPRRIGPLKVIGPPKMNVGVVSDDDNREQEPSLTSYRAVPNAADTPLKPDDLVWTYDSRLGTIKRRMRDVERDSYEQLRGHAQPSEDRFQAALQKQGEDMAKAIAALSAAMAAPKRNNEDDFVVKMMQMEQARLAAEKKSREEDLKFMREKMEQDRRDAEAARKHEAEKADKERKHEVELFEKRLDAERERFAEEKRQAEMRAADEKRSLEARLTVDRERLDAERKLAEDRLAASMKVSEDKLDKAHALVMEMVKEKQNPLENFMGLLTTVREVGDIINPQQQAQPAEPGETPEKKTVYEKLIEKLIDGATQVATAVVPVLQDRVRDAIAESQQAQSQATAPRQIEARPVITPQVVASQPEKQEEQVNPITEALIVQGVGDILREIDIDIDRNLPPKMSWDRIRSAYPMISPQLRAYATPDAMARELEAMAREPRFSPHAGTISKVASRIAGANKQWADGFLAAVRG